VVTHFFYRDHSEFILCTLLRNWYMVIIHLQRCSYYVGNCNCLTKLMLTLDLLEPDRVLEVLKDYSNWYGISVCISKSLIQGWLMGFLVKIGQTRLKYSNRAVEIIAQAWWDVDYMHHFMVHHVWPLKVCLIYCKFLATPLTCIFKSITWELLACNSLV